MSRILTCGWEQGHVDVFDAIGVPANVSVDSGTVPGSWSAYSAKILGGADANARFDLGASYSEAYFRFRWRVTGANASFYHLNFMDGTTEQCSLRSDGGSPLLLRAQRVGTVLGTASLSTPFNTWVVLEVHIVISATIGVFQVKQDGLLIIDLSNQNTKNSAGSGFTAVLLNRPPHTSSAFFAHYDDFAMNDTVGPPNNSWIGDGGVTVAMPNAAGDVTQLSRGGADSGANWSQVEERPPNDATDYVFGTTAGNRDLYNLPDLAAGQDSVNAVGLWLRATQSDPGSGKIAALIKSGVTENEDANQQQLTTAWRYYRKIYDKDPTDAAAWTQAKVNALQAGVTVR